MSNASYYLARLCYYIYSEFTYINLSYTNLFQNYKKTMREQQRGNRHQQYVVPPSSNVQQSALFKKVQKSIKNNRQSEIFYKAFLKPIEVALKTQRVGSLAVGLKQVFKTGIYENKYTLMDFQEIDSGMRRYAKQQLGQINSAQAKHKIQNIQKKIYDIQDVKAIHCDNLISLIKPTNAAPGLKLAICICMYSQDKSMLKRTLAGISQNIQVFARNNISPHQIGVFVIMDGIEPVDGTVEQYFQQLEKQNNIYLADDVQAADPRDLLAQQQEFQEDQDQVDNLNHLIFEKQEFQDRKMRRFSQRRRQYKQYKKLIKNIQELEKNKSLTYETLDPRIQKFFIQIARQQYKKDFACTEDEVKVIKQQVILAEYAQNIRKSSAIIKQALSETKKFCNEYISTRDNLALLNCFRVPISMATITKNNQPAQKRENAFQELPEQEIQTSDKQKTGPKMNLFLVTKYKNRGKLSSHNWFFNGFCQQLKPQYAVLLDVGLVPEHDSLWKMYNHMDQNPNTGGVCGYMALRIQKTQEQQEVKQDVIDCVTSFCMRFVDIQRAQQFQYHFAHLIDKPFESSYKFIHVLPGAFSAYRMQAILPAGQQSELLKQYFKSIDDNLSHSVYSVQKFSVWKTVCKVVLPDFIFYGCFGKPADNSYQKLLYDENVYLAQDRTLCMGIHQNKFDLVYLPDAGAWVDPIKTLYGLLGQRKRWINGSFFAFDKVKQTLDKSAGDCCLKMQIFYLTFMNALAYVSPALFMYTVHIAMFTFQTDVIVATLQKLNIMQDNIQASNRVAGLFVYVIDLIYVLIFLALVFYSMHLTNRENRFKGFFYGVSTLYGLFSLSVFGVLLYDILSGFISGKNTFLIKNPWFVDAIAGGEVIINSLRYIMLGIMGLYLFPALMTLIYKKCSYLIDIIFSTFSFLFFSPTYLNILNVYALCRMDDISWGTKGLNAETQGRKKQLVDQWKKIKLLHVSKYVLYNIVLGFLLLIVGDMYVVRFWFTFGIMVLIGFTLAFKIFIGTIYMLIYRCCGTKQSNKTDHLSSSGNFSDPIQQNFIKVRASLYESIRKSVLEVEKDYSKSNKNPISMAILSSKIYSKFKFGKDAQAGIKKSKNSINLRNSFSKIQAKNNSKIEQHLSSIKAQPLPITARQIQLNMMNKSNKNSENTNSNNNEVQIQLEKTSEQLSDQKLKNSREYKQINLNIGNNANNNNKKPEASKKRSKDNRAL